MKIALYQPDIAQNLGAIMRLCACFGVDLEIIEPCGFPLTTKALRRTAMDYGKPDKLIRHASWDAFCEQLPPRPARIVLMTTKAATAMSDFTFMPDDILLFGRESAGVPQTVHDFADERVFIPIQSSARSFNLASSASITVYEALRQTDGLP